MKKQIYEYAMIIIGTTLLAAGITMFYDKNTIVTGGVVGIAIIINRITEQYMGYGIPLWLTNLVLNIPLFIAAVIIKGRKFGIKSLVAAIYLSFALYFLTFIKTPTYSLLLSSIYGGVLSGIGLGLVFRERSTTGGTDLLASLINRYRRDISVGTILFIIDGIIIILGFYVFGSEKGLHAIIAVFVTSVVLDNILDGVKFAKAVYIISEKADEIGQVIINKLGRGVTALNATGVYSNKDKKVLFCVVSKRQIVKLKDMIQEVDENAFVVVYDAKEVLGEGFERQ